MGNVGNWLQGGVVAIIVLAGLFLSSHSKGSNFYEIGLILAVAGILYIFYLIKVTFDDQTGE